MLIRVQSPDGTKRIECDPQESTQSLYVKTQKTFDLPSLGCFAIYKNRDKTKEILRLERKTIGSYGVKHGDMIYLIFKEPISRESPVPGLKSVGSTASLNENLKSVGSSSSLNSLAGQVSTSAVTEDEVDIVLFKQEGTIKRPRDEKLCHHGAHAKCVHCTSIEPYDESYLKDQNIKHMSFHAYLRKLTGGVDKGKFAALENISCQIKPGCKEHLPWPLGICTKCQPSAITLNRQPYRHVDNVVFENPNIVERFLDYWRLTGHQRIGYLYGCYECHKDVPLGIKAMVVAIYEPPQESTRDSVKLQSDERESIVDHIASELGLQKVGWIFTDLIAEDLQKGTVKYLRNATSYFLSAEECIMAGYFQNQHPNPCRLSPDGYFGSKFVTVCVTGDPDHHIHMEGYQVSNQCMALVRDNCLVPTKDAPELGYVRESTNEQYVPDVFYKDKDSYGNEVTQLARPLPIEYLLVDVPASTPMEPQYTFHVNIGVKLFPIENRFLDGHIQDFNALSSYMRQFSPNKFLEAMSDFHVLVYIATMDTLPLKDALDPLLEAIRAKNHELASHWSRSEQWATVEQLIAAQSPPSPPLVDSRMASDSQSSSSALWTCRHCTFLNQPGSMACEICGLPQ
ncbi:nuclear protein localization 4 [Tachypleus tridentatus]|uniref:nuclear protein localization 4 n=1 Tax=Tachypleus tridentatus TaxID=6853 RepID=UPI003FD0ABA5